MGGSSGSRLLGHKEGSGWTWGAQLALVGQVDQAAPSPALTSTPHLSPYLPLPSPPPWLQTLLSPPCHASRRAQGWGSGKRLPPAALSLEPQGPQSLLAAEC